MRNGHMAQCEPCIQIQKKKEKMDKSQKERKTERRDRVRARIEREREREKKDFFLFPLRFTEIRLRVGFHRRKRQSWSTHQELRVGTKILEFRQTPRGIEFSYLIYF